MSDLERKNTSFCRGTKDIFLSHTSHFNPAEQWPTPCLWAVVSGVFVCVRARVCMCGYGKASTTLQLLFLFLCPSGTVITSVTFDYSPRSLVLAALQVRGQRAFLPLPPESPFRSTCPSSLLLCSVTPHPGTNPPPVWQRHLPPQLTTLTAMLAFQPASSECLLLQFEMVFFITEQSTPSV